MISCTINISWRALIPVSRMRSLGGNRVSREGALLSAGLSNGSEDSGAMFLDRDKEVNIPMVDDKRIESSEILCEWHGS